VKSSQLSLSKAEDREQQTGERASDRQKQASRRMQNKMYTMMAAPDGALVHALYDITFIIILLYVHTEHQTTVDWQPTDATSDSVPVASVP